MTRRMSCSLTIAAVRARTKTVTRRHINTWQNLAPGDRLTLIEKGMGLAKGERQVVLAEVEIVSNAFVRLWDIDEDECEREGFPNLAPGDFCSMWCESHHVPEFRDQTEAMHYTVRRIEWRYLDDRETAAS